MKAPTCKRRRDKDVEDCRLCGAALWLDCVDKRGRRKTPCVLRDLCSRCMAQPKDCQCGKIGENPETGFIIPDTSNLRQGDLWPGLGPMGQKGVGR